ncbi:MAG TPA: M15 family metallopeptidase, partial [Mycobacteriales bacterium]|nr:M15 family metallopeptidase [Mycobacteriales bacterium]
GELVVHRTVATHVVEVFRALFEADFPIEEMRLVTTADHHAKPTGDGNNTAAYNCRTRVGQGRWSAHAYGTAVDINPFHNPMVRRGTVVPEHGWAYVDRARVRPGMLTADGPAVRAFRAAGWVWGGDWTHSKDWMHFSTDGS